MLQDWGKDNSKWKKHSLPRSWWICTFQGLAIVCTVLSFYLIGEGMNHLLNPKFKGKD